MGPNVSSGRVYLDANVFIAMLESPTTSPLWKIYGGSRELEVPHVTSELTLAEICVKPIRDQDWDRYNFYNEVVETKPDLHEVVPVTRQILCDAANIRATIASVRLPDAIHLATALSCDCAVFLTNDHRLFDLPKRFPDLGRKIRAFVGFEGKAFDALLESLA